VLDWFKVHRENALRCEACYAAGTAILTNYDDAAPAAELHSYAKFSSLPECDSATATPEQLRTNEREYRSWLTNENSPFYALVRMLGSSIGALARGATQTCEEQT
jgi:hypothetical protein